MKIQKRSMRLMKAITKWHSLMKRTEKMKMKKMSRARVATKRCRVETMWT